MRALVQVFLNRNQFVPPITSRTLKMALLATTFFQKRLFEHGVIIDYLAEQKLLRTPNHQFDTENGYYVCLFGPTSFTGDDSFQKRVQLMRHKHKSIKQFMAEPKLGHTTITGNRQVASQDHETIMGNSHDGTKIAPPDQVCEKITGNRHDATIIEPPNQVREMITGNCKEASDIGTSCHIRHMGFRRTPRMKCTRTKNDHPDYRASDDSDGIDDRLYSGR